MADTGWHASEWMIRVSWEERLVSNFCWSCRLDYVGSITARMLLHWGTTCSVLKLVSSSLADMDSIKSCTENKTWTEKSLLKFRCFSFCVRADTRRKMHRAPERTEQTEHQKWNWPGQPLDFKPQQKTKPELSCRRRQLWSLYMQPRKSGNQLLLRSDVNKQIQSDSFGNNDHAHLRHKES